MSSSTDQSSSFLHFLSFIHHPKKSEGLSVDSDRGNMVALERDHCVRSKCHSPHGINVCNQGSISPTSRTSAPPHLSSMPKIPSPNSARKVCPSRKHFAKRNVVTFALMHQARSTTPMATDDTQPGLQEYTHQYSGFRQDYSLGEMIRSPSHMIAGPTHEWVIQAVNSLQKHDFAFIKRSDGTYSYAILAGRSLKPIKGSKNNATEEHMIFVMDDIGSIKNIPQKKWSRLVHLVSVEV